MNEAEWLAGADPGPMLKAVQLKQHRRALRLFACACCRRLEELLPADSLAGIEISERYADGRATRAELTAAQERATAALLALPRVWTYKVERLRHALGAAVACSSSDAITTPRASAIASGAAEAASLSVLAREYDRDFALQRNGARSKERTAQAELVRELFGTPFHEVPFEPEWRTDTVLALGRHIYETGEFGALPILADAVEEAGCADPLMLAHLRAPSAAHRRGCWVLDLVLDKIRIEAPGSLSAPVT